MIGRRRFWPLELKFDLVLCIVLFASLFMAFFFSQLHLLRPVADDYCFAASLDRGGVQALSYWYHETQFDLFALIMNLVFVGFPIFFLPASLASFFSFFCAVVAFSVFIIYLFRLKTQTGKGFSKFYTFVLISASMIVYFLSSLIFVSLFHMDFLLGYTLDFTFLGHLSQHFADVSNSWLMWGVVNSSYLYPFIFSFLVVVNLDKLLQLNIFFLVSIGILLGTIGYVLSVTTLIMVLFLTLTKNRLRRLKLHSADNSLRIPTIFLVASILIGILISFFSIGASARRRVLSDSVNLDLNTFVEIPFSLVKIFSEVFFNLGLLAPIFLGVILAFLLHDYTQGVLERSKELARIGTLYFIILFISVISSEIFSYKAYWHYFTLKFCLFIVILSFGIFAGSRIKRGSFPLYFSGISLSLLLTATILASLTQVNNRYSDWSAGLNYGALGSPGIDSPWVRACYQSLKNINPGKFYPELNARE